jgi:dienelactone hydrolase
VEYRQGDQVLEGYFVYDDTFTGPRPGVMVVHEWMGLNDYSKRRADQLAEMGYAAFAVDMYGKGIRPQNPDEARKLSSGLKSDRGLMRARINAALETFEKQNMVDRNRIAAIGYCFGGTVSLELARSGAEVLGVVSFHGGLDSPQPQDAKNIKGKVLVLHGADDPNVPPQQVADFQEEMRRADVDWQMVYYGDAVHSFTNPSAGNDKSRGNAYNAEADRRSWEAMRTFLGEVFQSK